MEANRLSLTVEPLIGPVTSLLNVEDVLLSGEGSFLHLYGLSKSTNQFMKVFASSNIHGIVRNPMVSSVHQICIFGGRSYRIVKFDLNFILLEMSPENKVTYWISDCCWVVHSGSITGLVLYLSNNTLSLHDTTSFKVIGTIECQESCILYSAKVLFEPNWNGVVALGGTVFNQIIIWSVDMKTFFHQSHLPKIVLHRLSGHKGVILGIDWNCARKELCSVSDDRSIRVYKMTHNLNEISFEDWTVCNFLPTLVLFGHTARVWRAKILESVIISIAEDATCAVWSNEGHMLKKFLGHRGKNIFSLEVNRAKEEIYTGGGDGSIRMWSFKSYADVKKNNAVLDAPIIFNPPLNEANDFPRTIRLIDCSRLLVMTDMGCILMLNILSKTWVNLMTNEKYSSYSLIEIYNEIVVVVNIHGWILLLCIEGMSISVLLEKKLYNGKIHSIQWLSSNEFLTTGPQGDVAVWQIKKDKHFTSLVSVSKYSLPMGNQQWVTAAAIDLSCDSLICGDRAGSIHVYDYPNFNQEQRNPVKSFPKMFGSCGVTCVCCYGDLVYCCGRNGQIYVFKGSSAAIFNIVHVFSAYKGFDWLSRILFIDNKQYVVGFLSDKFVVFDVCTNRFILSFLCGGGHRMWDFNHSKSQSLLAFIKKKQIALHQCHMKTVNSVIKPCHQGLGINCIFGISSTSDATRFVDTFITAGEDGLINIVSSSSSESKTETFYINNDFSDRRVMSLKGHTTGLKTMSAIEITDSSQRFLVFTAGAGGVIKAWNLTIPLKFNKFDSTHLERTNDDGNSEEMKAKFCEFSQHGVMLKQLSEHVLNTKNPKGHKPWRSFEFNEFLEARYMSIDALLLPSSVCAEPNLVLVLAGCSLGFLRIFVFNMNTNGFEVLRELDFHGHCILRVKHLIYRTTSSIEEYLWLLSTGTDGRVAFWDLTFDLKSFLLKTNSIHLSTNPSFVHKCHQSGINALEIISLRGKDSFLMCTGGDDNSIALTQFSISLRCILQGSKHVSAHSSQVKGVKFLFENHLLSVSIDQRLILWTIDEGFQLVMKRSIMLDVSDISDMLVVKYPENKLDCGKIYGVWVVGKGIQRTCIQIKT